MFTWSVSSILNAILLTLSVTFLNNLSTLAPLNADVLLARGRSSLISMKSRKSGSYLNDLCLARRFRNRSSAARRLPMNSVGDESSLDIFTLAMPIMSFSGAGGNMRPAGKCFSFSFSNRFKKSLKRLLVVNSLLLNIG